LIDTEQSWPIQAAARTMFRHASAGRDMMTGHYCDATKTV
jgi:hypothetical protein